MCNREIALFMSVHWGKTKVFWSKGLTVWGARGVLITHEVDLHFVYLVAMGGSRVPNMNVILLSIHMRLIYCRYCSCGESSGLKQAFFRLFCNVLDSSKPPYPLCMRLFTPQICTDLRGGGSKIHAK